MQEGIQSVNSNVFYMRESNSDTSNYYKRDKDMSNEIKEFEDHPILSDFGFWKYKNALTVDTLAMALEVVNNVSDLETARLMLTQLHDVYALASWPGGLIKKNNGEAIADTQ